MDLFNAKCVKVLVPIFHVKPFIPISRNLQALVDRENAVSVKFCMGLVNVSGDLILP
jgi:hypothetical protein